MKNSSKGKFKFPKIDMVDITLIKEYCNLMGYTSRIDRKGGYAKISNGMQSMYIVKAEESDNVVLGFAKTKTDKDGNVIYHRFEPLYPLLEDARVAAPLFNNMPGDDRNFIQGLFRSAFGLSYFAEKEFLSLQKGIRNE